jgi:hypothetical protein
MGTTEGANSPTEINAKGTIKMKATLQNVTINERNKDLIDFALNIDFSELCEHAAALAKVECNFQAPEIVQNRSGELFVDLTSDDITAQTGAFAAILKSCYIRQFSTGIFRDKTTGEPRCWVQLSMSYQHKNGGSNGMNLLDAWYNDREGWAFRDVG